MRRVSIPCARPRPILDSSFSRLSRYAGVRMWTQAVREVSIKDSLTALKSRRCRLGEQLIADGLIDEQQLRQGLERQRQTGAFLGETLASLGFVAGTALGRYLEAATGFPYVDLAD